MVIDGVCHDAVLVSYQSGFEWSVAEGQGSITTYCKCLDPKGYERGHETWDRECTTAEAIGFAVFGLRGKKEPSFYLHNMSEMEDIYEPIVNRNAEWIVPFMTIEQRASWEAYKKERHGTS